MATYMSHGHHHGRTSSAALATKAQIAQQNHLQQHYRTVLEPLAIPSSRESGHSRGQTLHAYDGLNPADETAPGLEAFDDARKRSISEAYLNGVAFRHTAASEAGLWSGTPSTVRDGADVHDVYEAHHNYVRPVGHNRPAATDRGIEAHWPPSPDCLPPTPKFDGTDSSYWSTDRSQHRRHSSGRNNLWANEDTTSGVHGQVVKGQTSIAPSAADVPMPHQWQVGSPDRRVDGPTSPIWSPLQASSPKDQSSGNGELAKASAAIDLSDWMSDAVWDMCLPLMNSAVGSPRRFLPGASSAFKQFAAQTIYQVSASSGALILALWYLHRLPIAWDANSGAVAGTGFDRLVSASSQIAAMQQLRAELLSSSSIGEIPWRVMTLGLTLSNKWLEDNTFTTKTWSEVTGLPSVGMRAVESSALAILDWRLDPRLDEWMEFLGILKSRESPINAYQSPHASAGLSPIGSERQAKRLSLTFGAPVSKEKAIALGVLDELTAEVRALKLSIEPVFPAFYYERVAKLLGSYHVDVMPGLEDFSGHLSPYSASSASDGRISPDSMSPASFRDVVDPLDDDYDTWTSTHHPAVYGSSYGHGPWDNAYVGNVAGVTDKDIRLSVLPMSSLRSEPMNAEYSDQGAMLGRWHSILKSGASHEATRRHSSKSTRNSFESQRSGRANAAADLWRVTNEELGDATVTDPHELYKGWLGLSRMNTLGATNGGTNLWPTATRDVRGH